jgi:hypothetical protein
LEGLVASPSLLVTENIEGIDGSQSTIETWEDIDGALVIGARARVFMKRVVQAKERRDALPRPTMHVRMCLFRWSTNTSLDLAISSVGYGIVVDGTVAASSKQVAGVMADSTNEETEELAVYCCPRQFKCASSCRNMACFKGVLQVKNGMDKIRLPSSMQKVGPTKNNERCNQVFLLIMLVFPDDAQSNAGQTIKPTKSVS